MCLAIFKPAGVSVPPEHIKEGWITNSHGGGYGFVKDGKAVYRKGLMKLRDFAQAYNEDAIANPDSPFLLHFRIRSMGDQDEINTHPHQIDGGILIHNGTLTGTGAVYSNGPSDTKLFVDMFKSNLSYDFIDKHKEKWNKAIGYGNKFAILYDDGRHQILNESMGVWEDGVWYSNRSYKQWGTGSRHVYDEGEWE